LVADAKKTIYVLLMVVVVAHELAWHERLNYAVYFLTKSSFSAWGVNKVHCNSGGTNLSLVDRGGHSELICFATPTTVSFHEQQSCK
jgi:hypothetical protein